MSQGPPLRSARLLGVLLGVTVVALVGLAVGTLRRPPATEAPPASSAPLEAASDRAAPPDATGITTPSPAPRPPAAREAGEAAVPTTPRAAAEIAPEDRAFAERYGEPTPALVRRAFEDAVARAFPRERLSSDEVELASNALHRLREARLALRALPMTETNAEERRALLEAMNDATEDFTAVMDVDPAEFSRRAAESEGTGGIDAGPDPDYVPDADFLEDRR